MVEMPSVTDHILALVFGIAIPIISGFRSAKQFKYMHLGLKERARFYLANSLFLALMALVVLIAWYLQGRDLHRIGLATLPTLNFHTLFYTAIFLVLYIGDIVSNTWSENKLAETMEHWNDHTPFLPRYWSEIPVYSVMCLAAGVGEEIVFRGFMIQYTLSLFPITFLHADTWAVVLPSLVFAVAHYYQGFKAVVKIAVLSILFGWIYLHSHSLWLVIALHFGVDWFGGVLRVKLMK